MSTPWTLPAIVNGKKVELTEIGDTLDVLDELDKGNWYKIKYDADGYVRGYEAIENQITDGDFDSSDCYINDVAQLEKALEVNDTVLLDQDFTRFPRHPDLRERHPCTLIPARPRASISTPM